MSVVIIGGGQGGYQTAASLRGEGYQESITIVGDEPHLPYQRPPLSKGILVSKQDARHALLRAASWYDEQRVTLMVDRAATIDRQAQHVTLASGARVPYKTLVLATGARNRLLNREDALYIRTLEEALAARERLAQAEHVAVIGGGVIGLETAAAARTLGKRVTVTEALPRLMARMVAPVVSEYFLTRHRMEGVEVHLGHVDPPAADLIIAGIGVVPNTELARDAGLNVANGIAVNEYLQTSDPTIYAIGDCAEFPSSYAQQRVRLESVQNAVDQATCVARAICGNAQPYDAVPWFWTDQFDIRFQAAGLHHGYDDVVVRGDIGARKFSVFYYRGGQLAAIDSINKAGEHLTARKLIAARVQISPEHAADESFDLKSAL